eukprot:6181942-Pleurochrysis_carterae.AAC.2
MYTILLLLAADEVAVQAPRTADAAQQMPQKRPQGARPPDTHLTFSPTRLSVCPPSADLPTYRPYCLARFPACILSCLPACLATGGRPVT